MFKLKKAVDCIDKSEEAYIKSILNCLNKDELYLVHGDCYYLNILFDKKKSKLTFIDFEYANLNPIVSDIANICNETVFDYDVGKYPFYSYNKDSYPKDNEIREMIKAFLMFWKNNDIRFKIDNFLKPEVFEEKLKACKEFDEIKQEEVEDLFYLTLKCAVLNNYYYLLWTFMDLRNSDFDFDYVLYARDRADTYLMGKKRLIEYEK